MKIHHGGTEITEKTEANQELRGLCVSVVNDFRPNTARNVLFFELAFRGSSNAAALFFI